MSPRPAKRKLPLGVPRVRHVIRPVARRERRTCSGLLVLVPCDECRHLHTGQLTPALDEKQEWRSSLTSLSLSRESRSNYVEALWKRQTAAERSSYVPPIAR